MSDPAVQACEEHLAESGVDTSKPNWRTSLSQPPTFPFDKDKEYFWKIETNQGPLRIKLMPGVAPKHVSSTMYLAKLGFYDGLKFHRVIEGFMAQGGCPNGDGRGGPGYQYDGEYDKGVRHDRAGLLSMANAGPGTDGSQFFLTFVPTPHLDDKHTIFGEVVEGEDTLRKLERLGTRTGATKEPLQMTSTSIEVE